MNYTIFGESHGPAIGVVLEGLPAGIALDAAFITREMERRRARKGGLSTTRIESDEPRILSGAYQGKTSGTPLCAVISNENTRSQDYAATQNLARPSHGDYTGFVRYQGCNDPRGGGHFSGRLTAPLVFAGAVAKLILRERGIAVGAHIAQIGRVKDAAFDPVGLTEEDFEPLWAASFSVLDPEAGERMKAEVQAARMDADSIGGIIECAVFGAPAGLGDPMFGGMENRIAAAVFGIPAVKGVEFGAGFGVASLRGSEDNDAFTVENGKIITETNHCGGILGGITNGMPIVFRAAFKPTPSIAREQQSVNLQTMTPEKMAVTGRHDPCIVTRAAPVVEAACAVALADLLREAKGYHA